MRTIKALLMILSAHVVICAQQPSQTQITRSPRCRGCVHKIGKKVAQMPTVPSTPSVTDFFVGEARVDVTKDQTVVKLAMAQHGSVLIELPANDGPRYIIPGDPEMATVDQKALERNKRAIVVRPGTQFLPPVRNTKVRTPSATVTAQMRSGLVVTFLFYPVDDLAQNVHRCVLNYNRDEVVARRRAAGLPVNLDGTGERGEMTTQSAAPVSISVEDTNEEKRPSVETSATPNTTAGPVPVPAADSTKAVEPKAAVLHVSAARAALEEAMKQPKRFKSWTKPRHGLSLSILQPNVTSEPFKIILLAVRNKSSDSLKLSPEIPELVVEIIDDHGKALNIESLKKLHVAASDPSGLIPRGGTIYYAISFTSPVLNARQQLRVAVGQISAADEPASIVLAKVEK